MPPEHQSLVLMNHRARTSLTLVFPSLPLPLPPSLMPCCRRGSSAEVKRLLAEGEDINEPAKVCSLKQTMADSRSMMEQISIPSSHGHDGVGVRPSHGHYAKHSSCVR